MSLKTWVIAFLFYPITAFLFYFMVTYSMGGGGLTTRPIGFKNHAKALFLGALWPLTFEKMCKEY